MEGKAFAFPAMRSFLFRIVRRLCVLLKSRFTGRRQSDLRWLAAEQLEPRILYSAAPVEVPATVEQLAPAQEAAVAVQDEANPRTAATELMADSEEIPSVATATAVAAPVDGAESGSGEEGVSPEQEVELVDLDAPTASLNRETVEALAAEARQRWIDSGISEEQIAALDSIEYRIADVGGAHLGVANGFSITIDDDAGGTGFGNWFIDATPEDDLEFGDTVSAEASGRFDLLSTLIHEQGHVLGLGDIYGDRTDVMDGFLDAGTRRLPVAGQADGAIVGSMRGENYLTAHIVLASSDQGGAEGNGAVFGPSISADGRFVAFHSGSTNLVVGDSNGTMDIFVKDLHTGTITRANTNAAGEEATGGLSANASISADGRYVAFESLASNLVDGDTNGKKDVFVKDLLTGTVIRASSDSTGTGGDNFSLRPAISADGRFVAFESRASNLVPGGTSGLQHIFVKDLTNGTVMLASSDSLGGEGNSVSLVASVSADGKLVAFESLASNLVNSDINGEQDVFVKNLETGTVTRVSTDSTGTESTGGHSSRAAISADGRFVVFESDATNLVASDNNASRDIFVKNLNTGVLIRVSTDAAGNQSVGGDSSWASISADGSFVAFESDATNLTAGDGNGLRDVFVKDLASGEVRRASEGLGGTEGNAASSDASLSADGSVVAFKTFANNLLPGGVIGSGILVSRVFPPAPTYTTSVDVDANGNLIIEDVAGGDTDDRLSIGIVDGVLQVVDAKNSVGSSIVGVQAVGTRGRGVAINLASFSGDIIVRTLAGDDRIDVGDLSGLPGGIVIEDGEGEDEIRQRGIVTLSGAGAIDYRAEQIRMERNSEISTDSGEILLLGNENETAGGRSTGLSGKAARLSSNSGNLFLLGIGGTRWGGNQGIHFDDLEIVSADGDVTLTGMGGATTGSGNRGIVLTRSTFTVSDGSLLIQGDAGGTGSAGEGVVIGRGSSFDVTGHLSVEGRGSEGGSGNRGVSIGNDVEIRIHNGALNLFGEGGNGRSSNEGLRIGSAVITQTGFGGTTLIGGGNGSGSGSSGVSLRGTTISKTDASVIDISGTGSATATGSGNQGVAMKSVSIHSISGSISIGGGSGSGKSSNYAIRVDRTSIVADAGNVTIHGNVAANGGWMTTGNANAGVYLSNSRVESGSIADVFGIAKQGRNGNVGNRLHHTDIVASSHVEIVGISDDTTTGSSNRGLFVRGGRIESNGAVELTGEGGSGVSGNESVHLNGTTVTSVAGNVIIEAGAKAMVGGGRDINSVTSGSNNRGVFLRSATLAAGDRITIDSQSGAGKSNNVGLQAQDTMMTSGDRLTINADSDASTTGNSNRGIFLHNSTLAGGGTGVRLNAIGGGGGNTNEAVRIHGGSVTATTGDTVINATAQAGTNGSNNSGAYVNRTMIVSAGVTTIDAPRRGRQKFQLRCLGEP